MKKNNEIEPINKSRADELMVWATSLQIVDQRTRQAATKLTLELRSGIKKIKAFYKGKKRKAKDAYDDLVAEEKGFIKPYLDARVIVDEKISSDYLEREQHTAELQENLRKLNTNNEEWSPDIVLPRAQGTIQTPNGFVNVRSDFNVEVTDRMALIKAVADADCSINYLIVDTAFIKKDLKQFGWANIPGIKTVAATVITGREK